MDTQAMIKSQRHKHIDTQARIGHDLMIHSPIRLAELWELDAETQRGNYGVSPAERARLLAEREQEARNMRELAKTMRLVA